MSIESVPAVKQTIAGWNISISGAALCQCCRVTLDEGDEVTAYAYRPLEEQLASVARLYCSECNHREIEHPARGCYEWLAEARLALTSDVALQLHSLTLAGIKIVDECDPQEVCTMTDETSSSRDESHPAPNEQTDSEKRQKRMESKVNVSAPSEDDPWSVHDVLSEMMAGWYSSGTCVEVHDYRLYNNAMDDEQANVWRVHPSDGGRAIDALNLDSFRSASDVEAYFFDEVSSE